MSIESTTKKKAMKIEQTAVDFMYEFVLLKLTNEQQMQFEGLFQQAKAIEKEQKKDCWETAHQAGRFEGKGIAEENWQTFEQYYNETYGDEKSMKTTQTVSDRINERPRKRTLNVVRKHERKEYHDLDTQVRFAFGADKTIVRYNNDLIPRTILIR